MEQILSIVKSLVPVITLILGAVLTYYFGIMSKRNESALKHKEEQYAKLLIKLQGFVGETVSYETKVEFFNEQYKSWLYSSDEVVKAINALIQLVIDGQGKAPDPLAGRKAIGNIVIAMRKDLHGKSKLGYEEFRYTSVYR